MMELLPVFNYISVSGETAPPMGTPKRKPIQRLSNETTKVLAKLYNQQFVSFFMLAGRFR